MKTATRWLPVGLVALVILARPDPALALSELASPQPLTMVSAHAMANFQLMTEVDDIIFADGFDCVDDQGCGEPVCVDTSNCAYDGVCDETGTKTQRCTPPACSRGSCVQGTLYYEQTVGCFRITDGDPCGLTTVGCPLMSFRQLCCSAAGACSLLCGPCTP
jgi:hypothetical protein